MTDSKSDFDKICKPCIRSKQICVIYRQNSRTSTNKKLKEVHANIWGLYDPTSLSENIYAAILICTKTKKI